MARTPINKSPYITPKQRRTFDWRFGTIVILVTLFVSLLPASFGPVHAASTESAVATVAAGVGDWSQFHGNASHAGFSRYPGPVKPAVAWTYDLGGSRDGVIAVNGIVIVSEPDSSNLTGLSESNGSLLYQYSTKPPNYCPDGATVTESSYPAVSGGLLFTEIDQGSYTYCGFGLSPDQWSPALGADYLNNQPGYYVPIQPASAESPSYGWGLISSSQGYVFFAGFGSTNLTAFLASTGTLVWTSEVYPNGQISTIPTVGGGVIVFGYTNYNQVWGLSETTGEPLWNFNTTSPVVGTPAYSNGVFYFGTTDGTFYAITSTGNLLWKENFGSAIESTPAIAGGRVFFGSDDGYLRALNATNGNEIWDANLGGQVTSSPVVSSNDIVYAGSTNGMFFGINATSGSIIWQTNLGAAITASPALDNGYLFVVTSNGIVYAFSSEVAVTLSYTVRGGGAGYSPPTLSYISYGIHRVVPLNTSPFTYMVDAGSTWNVTTTLVGSTPTERWQTEQLTSATANSSQNITFVYYHQYLVTADYSVSGGELPGAPDFASTAFGSPFSMPLTTQPQAIWVDAGAYYSVLSSFPSSNSSERWYSTASTAGTITSPMNLTVAYVLQYYVTTQSNPSTGGAVLPQSGWFDAGSSIVLRPSASAGWIFVNWNGSGAGSYTGSEGNATVDVNGPITETADFYPGVTVSTGQVSVTYSYGTTSGSIPPGATETIYAPPGTSILLTATPSLFVFSFSGWTGGVTASTNKITITSDLPTSLVANSSYNFVNLGILAVAIMVVALSPAAIIMRKRRRNTRKARKLQKLEQMLHAGLITLEDYEAQKKILEEQR